MIKLKSFTLVELLVSMVLTSILLSIAAVTVLLVLHEVNTFTKSNDMAYKKMSFQYLLMKDFEGAEQVYKSNGQLQFISRSDSLVYVFDDAQFIRYQDQVIDTFPFRKGSIELFNRGGRVMLDLDLMQNESDERIVLQVSKELSISEIIKSAENE